MSLAVVLGIGFLLLVSLVISDVGIGAGITALLFVLSKFLIGLYLAKSSIGSVYGPAGSLVLLLAWIYYASLVFLFGAEFAAVYAHRHGSRAIRDGAAHHRAWREPAGGAPLKRRVTRTAMYHGPQES